MNSHVIIAGGSSGIGAACRDLFVEKGHKVTSLARREQSISNPSFLGLQVDLTDSEATKRAVVTAEEKFGPVATLVHAAGDIAAAAAFADMSWERWRQTYDLIVGSAVHVAQACLPSLRVAGDKGNIVIIASVAARKPYHGISDYCAAKAALVSLTRGLADELASTRGRANCISPAVVRTALFNKAPFDEATAASWHRLGRIGEAREIAEMAVYLNEASWVTGQDYTMDGGMLL